MLKIFSHPRSGTHFLEAFVAQNFYPDMDLSVKDLTWGHWSNRQSKELNPYGQLFGGHHFPKRNFRLKPQPLLYIYRDGRAVAYSVWKTPNFLNKETSDLSFSKFLRTPIDWKGTPGHKSEQKFTIVEHWAKHVESWHKLKGNIVLISYEELVQNPKKVYRKILLRCLPLDYYKLLNNPDIKTIDKPLGLLPNKGTKDSWKEVFSSEDLDYFDSKTPAWLRSKFDI